MHGGPSLHGQYAGLKRPSPCFTSTGGVVPLGVPSDRKCPASAEKSPLGLQAVTDGDVPVSLTCLAYLLGERAARDREERVPSINRG
eukprot:scaffold10030_cov71-Phaeocystis_antarctica.AAC.3